MKHFRILNYFIALILLVLLQTGCQDNHEAETHEEQQTYTCPMHPQIIQEKPGTCPICGMDLVPFDKNNTEEFLTLGASQRALANITTMTAGENEFSNFTRLNARLAINPEKTSYISSRVKGRIEVLNIRETGVSVSRGQPLYKIYSEELATLQQEYLLMHAQAKGFPGEERFRDLEKAAKQKLLLYGQSEAQLKRLITVGKTDPLISFNSPSNGVVAELSVTEGQYVEEGSPIMKLESYENLWVEVDLYPAEAGSLKKGQQVQVIVHGFEDQPQTMRIDFINPSYAAGSQLIQARGTISNPGGKWQPGLQASVLVSSEKISGKDISIPADAIIRDKNGAHVYVALDSGRYEPRMIKTGTESPDMVEVTEGINKGERIVITGAYLLYSEFILKKGKDPMAGHNH